MELGGRGEPEFETGSGVLREVRSEREGGDCGTQLTPQSPNAVALTLAVLTVRRAPKCLGPKGTGHSGGAVHSSFAGPVYGGRGSLGEAYAEPYKAQHLLNSLTTAE